MHELLLQKVCRSSGSPQKLGIISLYVDTHSLLVEPLSLREAGCEVLSSKVQHAATYFLLVEPLSLTSKGCSFVCFQWPLGFLTLTCL